MAQPNAEIQEERDFRLHRFRKDRKEIFMRGSARGGKGHSCDGDEREIYDYMRAAAEQLRAHGGTNCRGF